MSTYSQTDEHPEGKLDCAVTDPNITLMVGEPIETTNPYESKYSNYTISEPYRYFLLVVASAGCLLASFCYTFALFSNTMMTIGKLDMSQMSSISTVMLVFSYFTLPYAFLYDAFGPKPVLIVGTVLLPLGCLLMALTFNGTIPANTVNFCVFLGIMGGGCIVFDIGTVVSVMSWFPTYRGPIVAVVKTFAGLGSAVVGTMQLAFFESNPSGFFFFLMTTSLILGLFTIASMCLPPYHLTGSQEKHMCPEEKAARHLTKQKFLVKKPPRLRMIIALAIVIFLIVFLPTQSALISYNHLGENYKVAFAVVVMVALAVYPVICLPVSCLGGMESDESQAFEQRELAEAEEAMPHACIVGEEAEAEEDIVNDLDYMAPQYQTTFAQSICTVRLWAIFATCFAVIGAQLVIIFHYSFIAAALRGKKTDENFKTLLATLNGVGSAVGRLVISLFEMWSQNRKPEDRIPITACLFMPCFFTLSGLVFYTTLPGDGIAFANFLMAVGNGCSAAAAVLVLRGIYAKEPAKHYNFAFLAAMLSAILLNRLAYGEWYHHMAKDMPGGVCFEKKCVLMPLLLMIGLNVLAVFGSFYIHFEYRKYCQEVLDQRSAALADESTQGAAATGDARTSSHNGEPFHEGYVTKDPEGNIQVGTEFQEGD